MDNKKSALKAGIWYTIGTFLMRSISFITTPIFTRLLTKSEIGIFSVTSTWISILTVVLSLNLYDTVILARYDYKDERRYNEYISTITILGTFSSGIFYVIVCLFPHFFANIIGIPLYALHIVFLQILFSPCMQILLAKFRTEMKYGETVMVSIFASVLSAVLSVLLVISYEDRLKARFIGTYVPAVIINIIIFFFLIWKGKCFKVEYCKYALPLALPMIIHYLLGTIMGVSDRIMIQRICSNEDVALYSLAYTCAMFVDVIRNSLNSAWDPWVFEKLNSENRNEIKKYSYYYLGFFVIICILIELFAPEILWILGGKTYNEAKFVIPPVILGYIFTMIYSLYSCLERYAKQQKWFALFSSISGSTNIILNLVFIPRFGYIAAAYTTLLCYCLSCVLHFFNAKKLNLASVYDTKFNSLLVFFCSIASLAIDISYHFDFLRYLFIIITLTIFVIFLKRNKEKMNVLVQLIRGK